MPAPFLIVLFALPLLELALLIKLGAAIGFWNTMAIILFTAFIGTIVVQTQGLASLKRANEALERDEPMLEPTLDGALRFIAGLLLISPGILMDIVGALLLIPPLRRLAAKAVARRMLGGGRFRATVFRRRTTTSAAPGDETPRRQPRPRSSGSGPVIEGEFERIDERPAGKKRDDERD